MAETQENSSTQRNYRDFLRGILSISIGGEGIGEGEQKEERVYPGGKVIPFIRRKLRR